MHLPSTFGLLALITTGSVQLVAASSQAVIHIEVDGVESMESIESVESMESMESTEPMESTEFMESIEPFEAFESVESIESMDYFAEFTPMTKAQADQVCAKDPAYGPKYQACMGGPKGAPSGCVCKPSACLQPCFGVQYTSPKDGSRGCCPVGQKFSYDPRSLEGACCSNGTVYSYDPAKKCGKCVRPANPCGKRFPGSKNVGGKNFVKYTNRGTWASNLYGGEKAKTFEDCEKVCATNPKCVAIDFQKKAKNCWPKSDRNDKVPPVENNDVDSAIIPPCLKKTDKCSAIDNTIRVYGGVAYTFKCKKVIGIGNVVPTYTTPDMLTCIRDCSKNPKCQGVNYPVNGGKGPCNLKSKYEANPGGNANYVAAVPLVKRG